MALKKYTLLLSGLLALSPIQASQAETSSVATPKLGDANFPNPRPSKRHTAKVEAVKSGSYDIALVGDSITQCLGDSGGEWEPIKVVWKKHYDSNGRKSINLGYSGYRTEGVLWNLTNGELDFKNPPKVFRVLIGTNNLDDEHYPSTHTAEQVFQGTKAIVDLIRKKCPESKIIVLRILPSGGPKDKTSYGRVYSRSAEARKALFDTGLMTSTLADNKHVFWLDINHLFLNLDGTINSDLMPDLIHPNAAGHHVMAQAIEPLLAQLLGDEPIVDDKENSAIVPVSKLEADSYDWFARHQAILKQGKELNPDVVFIGDSITHGWGGQPGAGAMKHAQKHSLDKLCAKIKVNPFNLGFGWDRTQNVLWRIDHGELDYLKPRVVVLNIGTNNTSETSNARANTAEEIVEGICACITRIQSKIPDAKIIVMAIFPREQSPENPRRKLIDATNQLLAEKLNGVDDVTLVDIGDKLTNQDGTISRDTMPDFCHLRDKAYKIWALSIAEYLVE